PFGDEIVSAVLEDMTGFPEEAVHLVQIGAGELVAGPLAPGDPRSDNFRRACFALLERIAEGTKAAIDHLYQTKQDAPSTGWNEFDRERIRRLWTIARELGLRVHLAAGAGAGQHSEGPPSSVPSVSDTRRRFLLEGARLLDLLAELAFPDVIHNLLQTLE